MFTVCLFISDGVDEDDGDVCEVCVFRFFFSLGVLEIVDVVVFIVAVTIAVYYC